MLALLGTNDHHPLGVFDVLGVLAALLVGYSYASYLRDGVSLVIVALAAGLFALTTVFGTLLET
ncbi:MAG: hypothetical protein ABR562_04470, partial [Thermoplasmatota archaeon]